MNYPKSTALLCYTHGPRELAEWLGWYAVGVVCTCGILVCRPQIHSLPWAYQTGHPSCHLWPSCARALRFISQLFPKAVSSNPPLKYCLSPTTSSIREAGGRWSSGDLTTEHRWTVPVWAGSMVVVPSTASGSGQRSCALSDTVKRLLVFYM